MDKFYTLVIYFTICLLILLIMYLKFFYLNVFESFTERNRFPAGMCKNCDQNSYVNETKTGCTTCDDGKEVNDSKTGCDDCPAGTAGTNGVCNIDCSSGNKFSPVGAIECSTCGDGKEVNDSKTGCDDCPAGTAGTNGVCNEDCDDNQYSSSDRTICIKCDDGTRRNGSKTGCDDCPAGTAGTNGYCSTCGSNQYSNSNRKTCHNCGNGTKPNGSNTSCVPCPEGTAGVGGYCIRCGAGQKVNDSKTVCLSKWYQWDTVCNPVAYAHGNWHASGWRDDAWMEVSIPRENGVVYVVIWWRGKAIYAAPKSWTADGGPIILHNKDDYADVELYYRKARNGNGKDDIELYHFSQGSFINRTWFTDNAGLGTKYSARDVWSAEGPSYSYCYYNGRYDY
jgi:hypothetical protein